MILAYNWKQVLAGCLKWGVKNLRSQGNRAFKIMPIQYYGHTTLSFKLRSKKFGIAGGFNNQQQMNFLIWNSCMRVVQKVKTVCT
jgi:hypothetical protein